MYGSNKSDVLSSTICELDQESNYLLHLVINCSHIKFKITKFSTKVCVSVKETAIIWDGVTNMITDITRVNLYFFIVIIVEIYIYTPTITSIDVPCRNEALIIDCASLIPPSASKTTIIINQLNKFFKCSKNIHDSIIELKHV